MSMLTPFLLSLLPTPITHQLLPHLTIHLPYIFPPSPRGSPAYQRNFKHVFTLIIVGYLIWSFAWGDVGSSEGTDDGGDWYSLLGVRRGAADDDLKRAFRTLSRTYHPDRAGPGAGPAAAAHFIRIRQAYEGLSDPIKRYAYDRFGPDILQWKAVTIREYMRSGINHSSGFYVASGGIMLLLSLLGRAKDGAFWRHLLFFSLLVTELNLVLRDDTAPSSRSAFAFPFRLLDLLTNHRPPFLQIRLLHRLFASLSVGISQLAGVWTGSALHGREPRLEDVFAAVSGLESEAVAGFHDSVAPLLSRGDPAQIEITMKRGMEEVLVDRAISTHPQIRPLWIDALQRAEKQRTAATSESPPKSSDAYPYPSPASAIPERYVQHSQWETQRSRVLGVATRIPLPPSPPPSPILGPRR